MAHPRFHDIYISIRGDPSRVTSFFFGFENRGTLACAMAVWSHGSEVTHTRGRTYYRFGWR